MKRNFFLFLLLILQSPLWTGCTALLWERSTLSTYYHPAGPPNLQLYYSEAQKDFLVQYDECRNKEKTIRTRYYWLEPNAKFTERGRKPLFLDVVAVDGLQLLPQTPMLLSPPPPALNGLYVVCRPDDI